MSKELGKVEELRTPENAKQELKALDGDLALNSTDLNYDYKEINDRASRILEWLMCVLSLGWEHNKIDNDLNAEAMKRQGAKEGEQVPTHPPADFEKPSGKEQKVINHYRKLESRKVPLQETVVSIINSAKNAIGYLGNLKYNLQDQDDESTRIKDLENVQQKFTEARVYLNNFRSAHNLRRPVKYELNLGNFWSIVIIYLIFETFVNGFFYSKVADGLLEGWGIAVTVATLVIAFGAGAGQFGTLLRGMKRHSRKSTDEASAKILENTGWHSSDQEHWYIWKRHNPLWMLSWGIITISCVIIGLLVVAFAYIYRDAAEYLLNSGTLDNLASTEATKAIMLDAGNRLRELALEPQSGLSAITLIVVNGLGFIMSFYKFHFQREDSIPGYVEACKELKTARDTYRDAIEKASDPLLSTEASKKTTEKSPENRVRELWTFIIKIKDGTEALKDILPNLSNEYSEACQNILESYREANKAARPQNDKEGPAYFKEFPEFNSFDIQEFEDAHQDLCETIDGVDINDIVRDVRKWQSKLIKEHVAESKRDLGIELTDQERKKKKEKKEKK